MPYVPFENLSIYPRLFLLALFSFIKLLVLLFSGHPNCTTERITDQNAVMVENTQSELVQKRTSHHETQHVRQHTRYHQYAGQARNMSS